MAPEPLWLALHLPQLPLEAHPGLPSPSAVAARGRVLARDAAADAAGVATGMSLAAARALAPTLNVVARDMAREAAALSILACWAGSFTPRISLVLPRQDQAASALLLDVGACLRLFGGIARITDAVDAGVAAQGYSLRCAVAPSAQGALWLAQAAEVITCVDLATLSARLAALPVAALDLPPQAIVRLAQFGVHTLADARRLPTAALARRIGKDATGMMARAFGELPDPRPAFVFPAHYCADLELPAAVDNAAALLFAARRLTVALAGWLTERQDGVRECVLQLRRRQQPTTSLSLRFATATRDAARFERVLRERLERLALTAPVEALRLEASSVEPLTGYSGGLFDDGKDTHDMATLLERLRARLGETSVHGLACRAEHRPECATASVSVTQGDNGSPGNMALRPFWLLARPQALRERDGRLCSPQCNGPLQLLGGPERIESGWWQEGEMSGEGIGDVGRDYFVALAADGRWLWIYRDNRLPGGWFLQGFFS
ncbi:MAG: DNA polymerase Y family protein [Rhodocyclaceae bacterium]|nr:MAG: DNA polymerase Y family protein [Rhodocyclaceae bacterium]